MQHAHEHGLVHRDIKPSNLMLSQPSRAAATPTVKVLDLGLALLEEGQVEVAGELTSTGQVMGTIDYMAPEQGADTHKVDIRADIYSLGATLYKLLTGKAPFAGAHFDTAIKKLMALANKEPPPVTTLRPDCPPELAKLVHQMLAKVPDARPTPPAAVAVALEPFAHGADLRVLLGSQPVTGRQDPTLATAPFSGYTAASAYDETYIADESAIRARATVAAPMRRTPRRRWLMALGALAATVACGVVITIATDNGTVEISAPEGVDFNVTVVDDRADEKNLEIKPGRNKTTIRTGRVRIVLPSGTADEFDVVPSSDLVVRRWEKAIFTLKRKQDAAKPQAIVAGQFDPGKPIDIPEPPPLEEWLKGRDVLTVAQDGSAQFTTIQSALNALQPGQVVRVLDRGPYRERLEIQDVPKDTGLVSDQGATIEFEEWKLLWKEGTLDHYVGHYFHHADGFRLTGFALGFPAEKTGKNEDAHGLQVHRPHDFLLERCWVKAPVEVVLEYHDAGGPKSSCVRECLIDGRLRIATATDNATTLVLRNYFGATDGNMIVAECGTDGSSGAFRICHNVFAGENQSLEVEGMKTTRTVDISNNTFVAAPPFVFPKSIPHDRVTCSSITCTRGRASSPSSPAHKTSEPMPSAIGAWGTTVIRAS